MTLSEFLVGLPLPEPRSEPERCPYCKRAKSVVAATGELGCPLCYDAFSTTLLMLVPAQGESAP